MEYGLYGSTPATKDKVYNATLQQGADGNSYYGVLVNEDSVFRALAYNNKRTFVATLTINRKAASTSF